MGKNDSFVDYANLGANLYQSVQLAGLRNQLTAIQQQAASEARQRDLEAKMREIIFVNDGIIDELEKYISRSPAGVAFLILTIKDYLSNDYGISTEKFQSFNDKREVKNIFDKIHTIYDQAVDKLDIAGVNDVKKNFELSFVISKVHKLKAHIAASSSIKKIEKRYNELVAINDKNEQTMVWVTLLWFILIVIGLAAISNHLNKSSPIIIAVMLCSIYIPVRMFKKINPIELHDYKQNMEKFSKDLLSDGEADELIKTFGVDTCEECDEISQAYNKYLQRIITTDTNGLLLDVDLLKLVYK